MLCVRATLALLAVVCAALASTGCCSRAYQGPRPVLAASRDWKRQARPVETFTIVFSTFIPSNYVLGPRVHPQSFCGLLPPRRLAFACDVRGFDVDSTCFRAKQVVTVIPEEADDGRIQSGQAPISPCPL